MDKKTKERYTKSYRKLFTKNKKIIEIELGQKTQVIIDEGEKLIDTLIVPELSKGFFSEIIHLNIPITAFYMGMKKNGFDVKATTRVMYRISDNTFDKVPVFLRKIMGRFMTTKLFLIIFKKSCNTTNKAQLKEDFILHPKRNNANNGYDLVVEECAVRKFYKNNNVEELAPYCSFFDYVQAKSMRLGIEHIQDEGVSDLKCIIKVDYKGKQIMRPKLKETVSDIVLRSEIRYNTKTNH